MKHVHLRYLFLLCALIAMPAHAASERKALVIGNAAYQVGPLRNPVNDAQAMTRTLKQHGFQVTTLTNADRRQMKEGIRRFTRGLTEQSVSLFYYAGHGIELGGSNYLIPVDADIAGEADVEFEAINAGRLLAGIKQANNGVNLVILDACRNNPYSRGFRSASRGLARMQPASGSYILYATEPGNVAADGEGGNGVFTQHLIEAINQPGQKIEEVFKQTANQVRRATGAAQTPYIEGVIIGDFYINQSQAPLQLAGGSVTQVLPAAGSGGVLEVTTRPSDAQIEIDGIYSGQSPKRITDLASGVHKVRASKEGYQPESKQVRISQGETLKLTLLLDPEQSEPTKLGLWVKPTPEDARVRILNIGPKYRDGIELEPGSYHLEITAPGYQRHTHRFELAEESQVYAVELQREAAEPQAAPPPPPASGQGIGHGGRYIDNGDGTVTDTVTQLQWMRCSVGQSWTGSGCTGEQKKMKWDEAKDQTARYAGHNDWRLPSIEELRSLVYCSNGQPGYFSNGEDFGSSDLGCKGKPGKDHLTPTLDPKAFPSQNISAYWFWSSSAYASGSDSAWIVPFGSGYDGGHNRDGNGAVRLVRGGQ